MNLAKKWSQRGGGCDGCEDVLAWGPSFSLARVPFPGTDAPAVVNCLHILARSLDARYGLGALIHT